MSKRPPTKSDPEDLPTAMWSPVARSLFADEFTIRAEKESSQPAQEPMAEEQDTVSDMPDSGGTDPGQPPLTVAPAVSLSPPTPVAASAPELCDDDEGDTLQVWPKPRKQPKKKPRRPRRGSRPRQPETGGTPPYVAVAGEITDKGGATLKAPQGRTPTPLSEEEVQTDPESLRDTLDEPPSAEILEAARKRELSAAKLKVAGAAQAPASRVISPHTPPVGAQDSHATMLVDPIRARFKRKASHECRICGRKVTAPRKHRLRGPINGGKGFQCERCENDFCAGHVVRVSGLWESLIFGGRFSCLLCQDE